MSRRDKMKADEKVWIAKAYTQGKIGLSEAALEDRRGQRKKDQQPRTELEQA